MSKQNVYKALDTARPALHPELRQFFHETDYDYATHSFAGTNKLGEKVWLVWHKNGNVTFEGTI